MFVIFFGSDMRIRSGAGVQPRPVPLGGAVVDVSCKDRIAIGGHAGRRAFTLVELLVVVAILGIIAGMLLPAMKMVRESAKKANCQSNQRQVGMAILQYTNDNESSFPSSYSVTGGYVSWDDLVSDYDGRDLPQTAPGGRPSKNADFVDVLNTGSDAKTMKLLNLYRCPSEDAVLRDPRFLANRYFIRSYGMNRSRIAGNVVKGIMGFPLAAVTQTIRTILLAEVRAPFIRMGSNQSGEYIDNPFSGPATATNGTGCMGQVGQPSTGGYVPGGAIPLHGGQWNYLFCDGHVQTLAPSATVGPNVPLDGFTDAASMWWR